MAKLSDPLVLSREQAVQLRRKWAADGLKVAFTNGCFDILHVGHARYLAEARALADRLIVGVNSDRSTRALKGENRPVNPQQDRAELLASLKSVDAVTIFDEDTPVELIRLLQPDIHVKGGDYRVEDLPEAAAVREYGGEVRVVGLVPGKSTTRLVDLIRGTEEQ